MNANHIWSPAHSALSLLAAAIGVPAMAATITATVVDNSGAPVVDAIVFAVPLSGATPAPRTPRHASIEQVDREFVPYVTAVQTGTTVTFPNRDHLLHHVYSFSPVKNFEIKLYSGDTPRGVVFDKPGVVTLGCNIHDWMIGYVFVVDTPHFAKTDSAGAAHIADMNSGEYQVRLWHPRQRAPAASAIVKLDAKNSTLNFTLDTTPRKQKFKPPANPIQYK